MDTTTWNRFGGLLGAKIFKRTRKLGITSVWSEGYQAPKRTGLLESVTSVRSWPRPVIRSVKDYYRATTSGLDWDYITRGEKDKVREKFRIWKNHQRKPINPYYHTFKGHAESPWITTPWMPQAALFGGGEIQLSGHLANYMFISEPTSLPASVPSSWISGCESRLFQKASQPKFDTVTQVGEMLETLAMLRSPLTSLREASQMLYDKLKKETRVSSRTLKPLKGKDLHEAVSGVWLEYSFGVAPLIFGTAKIASDLVDAVNDRVVLRLERVGSRHDVETRTVTRREYDVHGFVRLFADIRTHDIQTVRGGMYLTPNKKQLSLASSLGLSSMRAVTSQAWALFPLSFAVDWFVGIGPLLDECRPLHWNYESGYITDEHSTEHTVYLTAAQPGGTARITPIWGTAKQLTSYTNRRVGLSRPGTLQLGPGLFSLSQGLSLAALAAAPISKLWSIRPWH